MKNLIPYFDSEYSFAYYKIPNYETEMISKVSFPQEDSTIVVATNFVIPGIFRATCTWSGSTPRREGRPRTLRSLQSDTQTEI